MWDCQTEVSGGWREIKLVSKWAIVEVRSWSAGVRRSEGYPFFVLKGEKFSRNDTVFLILRLCESFDWCLQFEIHQLIEKNGKLSWKYFGTFEQFENGNDLSTLEIGRIEFPKIIKSIKDASFPVFPEKFFGKNDYDFGNGLNILFEQWEKGSRWNRSTKYFSVNFTNELYRSDYIAGLQIFQFWTFEKIPINKSFIDFKHFKTINKNFLLDISMFRHDLQVKRT